MRKLKKNHITLENSIHAYWCSCDCSAVAGCGSCGGPCANQQISTDITNAQSAISTNNGIRASSSTQTGISNGW